MALHVMFCWFLAFVELLLKGERDKNVSAVEGGLKATVAKRDNSWTEWSSTSVLYAGTAGGWWWSKHNSMREKERGRATMVFVVIGG